MKHFDILNAGSFGVKTRGKGKTPIGANKRRQRGTFEFNSERAVIGKVFCSDEFLTESHAQDDTAKKPSSGFHLRRLSSEESVVERRSIANVELVKPRTKS